MYNVGIKKSTFYLHISLRQGCGVGAEQQKEGRVKDFSNLSFASLCLRCIHKLEKPGWFCATKQRRNGEKYV